MEDNNKPHLDHQTVMVQLHKDNAVYLQTENGDYIIRYDEDIKAIRISNTCMNDLDVKQDGSKSAIIK